MEGNIKNYLNGIGSSLPSEIISQQTYSKLNKMATLFSDFVASQYIFETHLNKDAAEVDFSFRVLAEKKSCLTFTSLNTGTWKKIIKFVNYWPQQIDDVWFEMDYKEYDNPVPQPCFFFNGSNIKKGNDVDYNLLFDALEQLLGNEQVESLSGNLKNIIQCLPPEAGIFQVGTMLARNSDRVRICIEELTREQVVEYLSTVGWMGSFTQLDRLFQLVHQYSDGKYILDFDVTSQGISKKIGVEVVLGKVQNLPAFLENLVTHHLCTDVKRRGVLRWPGSKGYFLGPDYGYAALIKNICHFKLSCLPEESLEAKAYLRVMGIYFKELLK